MINLFSKLGSDTTKSFEIIYDQSKSDTNIIMTGQQ